jgi:hypothetical protein
MTNITEIYADQIDGVITCVDRLVLHGTLQNVGYAKGMTSFCYGEKIRIFDSSKQPGYTTFAKGLKDELRAHIQAFATEQGVEIKHLKNHRIRKLDMVKKIIRVRGEHYGLVCVFSAMEKCSCFTPWHDKNKNSTYLRYSNSQCLHYYLYFIDEVFGLCSLRVPTWSPFALQFFCNGHHILKTRLDRKGVQSQMLDNSFEHIDSYAVAQKMAGHFPVNELESRLNAYAELCCPVSKRFETSYHWSIAQLECATDIIFRKEQPLQEFYSELLHSIMQTVTVQDIATFLGRRLTSTFNQEAGSRYNVLYEGTRVKHSMGKHSIKIYDKFRKILRIETTTNDVRDFKIFRRVNHRDGTSEMKNTSASKAFIYLNHIAEKLAQANNRYIQYISAFTNHTLGRKKLAKVTTPVFEKNRSYKGFNFFDDEDVKALEIITRGEINIRGFRNKDIRKHYKKKTVGQISRLLKRMRVHGLIKKVVHGYKYYLTDLGKEVIIAVQQMKENFLVESLC